MSKITDNLCHSIKIDFKLTKKNKLRKKQPPVWLSVNGSAIIIKRGKWVKINESYYLVAKHCMESYTDFNFKERKLTKND